MTRYEALMAARNSFPSEKAMAEALGVSQPTIWRWINQSKQLPAEYVIPVARLTGVSPHDLRDDIYPRDIMVDGRAGFRFDGIDQRADVEFPHADHANGLAGRSNFNRGELLKAGAR